jgi:hypothetical protein
MAQLEKFKISSCIWQGDTHRSEYYLWVDNMGSIVRALEHGPLLENSLDEKLCRPKHQMLLQNVSSAILNDPDFAPANGHVFSQPAPPEQMGDGEDAASTASAAVTSITAGSHFSLGQSSIPYADFPDGAKELDALLYNVLRMNVRGTKSALLDNVTFPSYIQGMIVLDKHMNISKMDRIMAAYSVMDKITYKSDALSFMTSFMGAKRELDRLNAGRTHYVMCNLMRAFSGKSKTIQFHIAEDFNNLLIDDNLNVHDLVQKYCSMLATVGDGNGTVAAAQDQSSSPPADNVIICHHCGVEGHKRPDCPKFKQEKQNAHKKRQNDATKRLGGDSSVICHHCNKPGHIRPNCPDYIAGKPAHPICTAQLAPNEPDDAHGHDHRAASQQPAYPTNPINVAQLSDTSALSHAELQNLVSNLRSGQYPCRMVKATVPSTVDERIAMSACDGIGMGAYILNRLDADITRYIGIETSAVARTICNNLNPPNKSHFNGVDHSWHTDVYHVTEDDIAALGHNRIKMYIMATPCEDWSKYRLLPSRYKNRKSKKRSVEPRPGLRGKKGAVTIQALQIWSWILKYNPECEMFSENIKFDDMQADWQIVCKALGTPLILDAADYSMARRVRAYWSNIQMPDDMAELTAGYSPGDPNTCMDPGRTIEPYFIDGKKTMRTIGGSWSGDPDSPIADTAVPVVVHDEQFEKAQHVRVNEVERLVGLSTDATAGGGVSAKDRLICLGKAWDIPSVEMQLRFSRLMRKKIMSAAADHHGHLRSQLKTARLRGGGDAVVSLLAAAEPHEQQQMLLLLAEPQQHIVNYAGSVLDSGSSRHLSPMTQVTHSDDKLSLTGFDKSEAWTEGNGYLPLELHEARSDKPISMDLYDADKFNGIEPILSMGKMIRLNWTFHFESASNCYAVAPDGLSKFLVDLCDDDVIRLPHDIRGGARAVPLPHTPATSNVFAVRRTVEEMNSCILHDIFCHRSMEKIYRTLLNTVGFEAIRLPDMFCGTCAQMKSKARGLRQQSNSHIAPVVLPAIQAAPAEEDFEDTDDGSDDDEPLDLIELEYTAPVAGRSLGIQPVPQLSRFELEALRPFEIMFADNKDYEQPVRGGKQVTFVLYDLKSTGKFKVDLASKAHNGTAFRKIVAMNGVHKLPYSCRIYTDGCGSMIHVEVAAVLMGIDHANIPPYMQSLNEAEKICYSIWDDAAAIMHKSQAPSKLFNEAVSYCLYVNMRTATTASRGYKTPYEIIKGVKPSILKLHRFFTLSYANVPRQKRKQLAKKGFLGRAEPGRLLGFQSIYSSTFRVLLSRNRLIHSISVTFDDSNFVHGQTIGVPAADVDAPLLISQHPNAQPAADAGGDVLPVSPQQQLVSPQQQIVPPAFVQIEHCDLFDQYAAPAAPQSSAAMPDDGEYALGTDGTWTWHRFPLEGVRNNRNDQPSYVFLCRVDDATTLGTRDATSAALALAVEDLVRTAKRGIKHIDHFSITQASGFLALVAQKNIQWKKALAGPDCDKAIAAFHAERDSLMSNILELLSPDHPEYSTALSDAVSGRFLLDERRSGMWKARGVKQGFKEDRAVDGPGFVYYSHVVKLYTIRISLFRPNRGTRRIAIRDVKTAFLQSDKFPPDVIKYMKMYNPLELEWEYFRQWGPIYGEYSGNVRWEDTYAPYYEAEDFVRGDNERCVFYHDGNDLLVLVYTDDNFFDGEEDSIEWGSDVLSDRFECKDLQWIVPMEPPTDYLGMELAQSMTHTSICMATYIENCLIELEWTELKPARVPMTGPIDADSPPLSVELCSKFHTGIGFLSWLSNTCRLDITHTWNRISQHQANPTESAFAALRQVFRYLSGTKNLQLAAPINSADLDLNRPVFDNAQDDDQHYWEFYCDSDFAGNTEDGAKRRSQNGYIALLNGAPVFWASKITSVCFATELIGEAHADMSSGAAEIYCAGNATMEFLHLSYVADEMNIKFPKPFKLQMDNAAAECFANNTCFKSKLKHIDCRQQWVKILRDHEICTPAHVDSRDNLADILTKILPVGTFERLRDQLMFNPHDA